MLVWYVGYRAASLAAPHPDGTSWGYLEIANNWDGTWYQRVAAQGYPDQLPHDATGAVAPSTWAFYPLFPRLVSYLMQLTGLSWTPAATVVALACSAGAVVVIRSLLARLAGPKVAIWAVALFCFFPAAAVLQLPYAESTALSKALKKNGFVFVGPTTAYATMQACGLVDDHLVGCHARGAS